jgi:hypothetical protein
MYYAADYQLKIRFHRTPRIMFGPCPARTSPPYRILLGSIDLGGQQGITDKGDIAGDDPRVLHNPLPQSPVGLHSVPHTFQRGSDVTTNISMEILDKTGEGSVF